MMTIGEYIRECEIRSLEERIEKLEKMDAPGIIINSAKKAVVVWRNSINLPISGDKSLLDLLYVTREVKQGRGGKVYIDFGTVLYFPHAKHGAFITVKEGK